MDTSTATPTTQPDRLFKLACQSCGAVARISDLGMRLSGGLTCSRDGLTLVPVARRKYTRRTTETA